MIVLKRLETVQIESTTKHELVAEIEKYKQKGYNQDGGISKAKEGGDLPFFAYVQIDEFDLATDA